MCEYAVIVESVEDTTRDEETLARFHEAIEAQPEVLGPSASLDKERGVLTSTFRVVAEQLDEAQDIAERAFTNALRDVGLRGDACDVVQASN